MASTRGSTLMSGFLALGVGATAPMVIDDAAGQDGVLPEASPQRIHSVGHAAVTLALARRRFPKEPELLGLRDPGEAREAHTQQAGWRPSAGTQITQEIQRHFVNGRV